MQIGLDVATYGSQWVGLVPSERPYRWETGGNNIMQTDIEGLMQSTSHAPKKSSPPTGRAEGAGAAGDDSEAEPSVIDELREKGFMSYLKEVEARKKEELREKILQAMGLSEEDLAKMSPENRGQIEDMIAEEIRQRMMSQSIMNAGDAVPRPGETSKPAVTGDIQNGMGSGLTLINAMEQAETEPSSPSGATDRDDG